MNSIFRSNTMTWGVVALICEPAPLVYAFAAHYINLGADQVTIYLDAPNAALKAGLEANPKLRVIECNDAFWEKYPFHRPFEPTWRQKIVAQECYNRSKVDWLLHCDADEFLCDDQKLFETLADPKNTADYLLVRAIERVHLSEDALGNTDNLSIFSGSLRLPYPNDRLKNWLHKDVASMMLNGFTGYLGGKSFLRCGRRLKVGIHLPTEETKTDIVKSAYSPLALAHFDGLTPNLWTAKQVRKMQQRKGWRTDIDKRRTRLLEAIEATNDDKAKLKALHDKLKSLTPEQETALRERNLLRDNTIQIEDVARDIFPDQSLDFTQASFEKYTLDIRSAHNVASRPDYDSALEYQKFQAYRTLSVSPYRFVPKSLRGLGFISKFNNLFRNPKP